MLMIYVLLLVTIEPTTTRYVLDSNGQWQRYPISTTLRIDKSKNVVIVSVAGEFFTDTSQIDWIGVGTSKIGTDVYPVIWRHGKTELHGVYWLDAKSEILIGYYFETNTKKQWEKYHYGAYKLR